MEEGDRRMPAVQRLPEMQDWVLIDTGIRLELCGGLALGVIGGVEWLCMLCPRCHLPTMRVNAWAWCGHCGEPLTRLWPVQWESRYYNIHLLRGLCMLQPQDVRKAREGRGSPASDGGEQPSGMSTSEFRDIWEKETAVETHGLVKGPGAAGVSVRPLVDIPEEPTPRPLLCPSGGRTCCRRENLQVSWMR